MAPFGVIRTAYAVAVAPRWLYWRTSVPNCLIENPVGNTSFERDVSVSGEMFVKILAFHGLVLSSLVNQNESLTEFEVQYPGELWKFMLGNETMRTVQNCIKALGLLGLLSGVALAQNFSPQGAVVTDQDGMPTGITEVGQKYLLTVPLANVTSSSQTNTIGVGVSLNEGFTVFGPVSDYGTVGVGATTSGTAYRVRLDGDGATQRRYSVKLGVKSDQGQHDYVVGVPGSTGFGDGSQLAVFPNRDYPPFTVAVGVDYNVTDLDILPPSSVEDTVLPGTVYRSQRTGELIHVSHFTDPIGKTKLKVRRGQFGNVTATPLLAGDVFEYEGVAIPDGVAAGVELTTEVDPVEGPIGDIKVVVGSIVHPRMSDLMITLTAEDRTTWVAMTRPDGSRPPFNPATAETTSVIVLAPFQSGVASLANIENVTFIDSASIAQTDPEATMEPGNVLKPFEAFRPAPVIPDDDEEGEGEGEEGEEEELLPVSIADIDGSRVTHWTIRVSDVSSPSVGYVKALSVEPAN